MQLSFTSSAAGDERDGLADFLGGWASADLLALDFGSAIVPRSVADARPDDFAVLELARMAPGSAAPLCGGAPEDEVGRYGYG